MQHEDGAPMEPNRTDQQAMRICGFAGLLGASLLLVSDWLMLGTFTHARTFARDWLTILAEMPGWRVTYGAVMGPLGAWLYIIGFWQLYLALRPAAKWLAVVCWAGFAIGFTYIAGAFHASFPFMAYAAQSMAAPRPDIAKQVEAAAGQSFQYARLLFMAAGVPALIGCLTLAYAVLMLRTRYPRWAILFNPLVLYAATLLFRYVPAPLGGLLYIGYGNIMFIVYFAASTMVLWHCQSSPLERTRELEVS